MGFESLPCTPFGSAGGVKPESIMEEPCRIKGCDRSTDEKICEVHLARMRSHR